ncbi:hypothetical protein ACQUWZ_27630, partial [Ralstonia pseudosolanacearum]|uniref:hypothetical protein n=1 Tax=Ralstonia pseudosolanacearum TaxID=1310165 RepID=UPI003D1665AF
MMSNMPERDLRITDDLISALASSPTERNVLADSPDRRKKLTESRGDLEDDVCLHQHAAEATAADFKQIIRDLLEYSPVTFS